MRFRPARNRTEQLYPPRLHSHLPHRRDQTHATQRNHDSQRRPTGVGRGAGPGDRLASPATGQRPADFDGPPRHIHLRRRGGRRRQRGVRAAQPAHDRRSQANHRPHPPHLDRPVRRAGHDGDGRDQDRSAGAQDREAHDARRADARRRVPADAKSSAATTGWR